MLKCASLNSLTTTKNMAKEKVAKKATRTRRSKKAAATEATPAAETAAPVQKLLLLRKLKLNNSIFFLYIEAVPICLERLLFPINHPRNIKRCVH